LAGVLAGVLASLAVSGYLRSLLFGIRAADPLVIGLATLIFLIAACIAGGLPARRAATADPSVVLRCD
jgi:ABC-type antimicrobial peptide transport system permease subunit